jgi:acyl-CoA dehydrogenase
MASRLRQRDFWGEKIGQAYAKAGPDALWASLSASKYAA